MHTISKVTEDLGTVRVHYNSDFSGDTIVNFEKGGMEMEFLLPRGVMLTLGKLFVKETLAVISDAVNEAFVK